MRRVAVELSSSDSSEFDRVAANVRVPYRENMGRQSTLVKVRPGLALKRESAVGGGSNSSPSPERES